VLIVAQVDRRELAAQGFKAASVMDGVAVVRGACSAVRMNSPLSIFLASWLSTFMQPAFLLFITLLGVKFGRSLLICFDELLDFVAGLLALRPRTQ